MLQNIPERSSYGLSSVLLLSGIFFSVYPLRGILENDLVLMVRPGGKAHHSHGIDAVVLGVCVMLLGISNILAAIRNILEERQRQENFYQIKKYAILNSYIAVMRKSSFVIIFLWCFYAAYISLA